MWWNLCSSNLLFCFTTRLHFTVNSWFVIDFNYQLSSSSPLWLNLVSLVDHFVQSYVSWNPSFYVSTGRSRKPSFKDKTNNHQYNTCYHRLMWVFRFFVEPAKKAWLYDLIVCGLFSRQEGWRLENEDPTDPKSPLVFKGVVFNEMKGAFVSWHSHKASKCIEYNIFINAFFFFFTSGTSRLQTLHQMQSKQLFLSFFETNKNCLRQFTLTEAFKDCIT